VLAINIGLKDLIRNIRSGIMVMDADKPVNTRPEIRPVRSWLGTPLQFFSDRSRDLTVGHPVQRVREIFYHKTRRNPQ